MGREGEKNGHERMRMIFMAAQNLEGDNVGTKSSGFFVCVELPKKVAPLGIWTGEGVALSFQHTKCVCVFSE